MSFAAKGEKKKSYQNPRQTNTSPLKRLGRNSSYLAGSSVFFSHGSMKKFNRLAKNKLLKIFISSIKTKVAIYKISRKTFFFFSHENRLGAERVKWCCPLCCSYLVGGSVKCRFIEFFVFDCDSLPYLLSLFFLSRVTFPLVAADKMTLIQEYRVTCWLR